MNDDPSHPKGASHPTRTVVRAGEGGRIRRIIGVYDADGTLRAEIGHWLSARLGRRPCALCDITHGPLLERRDWRRCRTELPVRFDTYHRDDQPREVAAAAAGRAPVVLVETATDAVHLLGPEDIAACQGSPGQLVDAILAAVARQALSWPAPLSPTVTRSSPSDPRPTAAQQPKARTTMPERVDAVADLESVRRRRAQRTRTGPDQQRKAP